jgi:hypothetical protein
MNLTLTSRDHDLLETLTCRVSVLTAALAAQLTASGKSRRGIVRRRLRRLASANWLELQTVNAHPLLPVTNPIFAWQPGDDDPDAERLSQLARRRWSRPARPMEVCIASRRAASLFASTAGGRFSQRQVDHDLRLASVYVHYRVHHSELARRWIGEHALPKAGYRIKDPDAFLRDGYGCVFHVIESAGRYTPRQIESFHEYCVENQLGYELW